MALVPLSLNNVSESRAKIREHAEAKLGYLPREEQARAVAVARKNTQRVEELQRLSEQSEDADASFMVEVGLMITVEFHELLHAQPFIEEQKHKNQNVERELEELKQKHQILERKLVDLERIVEQQHRAAPETMPPAPAGNAAAPPPPAAPAPGNEEVHPAAAQNVAVQRDVHRRAARLPTAHMRRQREVDTQI
jgi:hypothetical protein